MDLESYLKNQILIFDGAMGTMLQCSGLKAGDYPEVLNLVDRERIIEIHKKYIAAGSKVITTNTFGANEVRLENTGFTVEEIISAAVKNAKEAARGSSVYIALDIGPIGKMLEPAGKLSFERAYEIFRRQVAAGVKSGVDLILIETMTDLYEAKAAVLAAKENSNIPVLCTMSYDEGCRTFMGCSPVSMVLTLQGLGVDAVGVNCSLGPMEIEPIVDEILKISRVPVMVQPNAGLPKVVNDKTVYSISPEKFAEYSYKFVKKGVRIIGGCCGTTDLHIKKTVQLLMDVKIPDRIKVNISGVCTPSKYVLMDDGIKVIGERINPTGKERLRQAVEKGDMEYILEQAVSQAENGADILDVNVGLPGIDEAQTMVNVIKAIQSVTDVPLQVDSNNPHVLEQALRIYNGKAIVNSVNGQDKMLDRILPLVKKYGAAVIGLTMDENGIPESAEDRYKIACKIVKRAQDYGIPKEDVYIDCLTLASAACQKDVGETLKALSMVKQKLNVKTVLGVSNISYGLPNRGLLNRTFLSAALWAGLDLPIINPCDKAMMDTIKASRVLWNEDKGAVDYIKYINGSSIQSQKPEAERNLYNAAVNGLKEEAKKIVRELLKYKKPMEIVNQYIIPALDLVGERYERGDIFLPQLINSSETVQSAFEVIREEMKKNALEQPAGEKIILATVQGDVHDIGKNILKMLLENYGYLVYDMGSDVSAEKIVREVIKNDVKLVGLSALMTTSVKNMEQTIKILKQACPGCRVIVGGAVLNKEYANSIGADYYAGDAREGVEIVKRAFSEMSVDLAKLEKY